MKLGITNGIEFEDLESEQKRLKNMNGLRRCKAHDHLTEYVPCKKCKEEGKTGEYQDFFLKEENNYERCNCAYEDSYFGGRPSPSCGGYGTVITCSGNVSCPICPGCGQFKEDCTCKNKEEEK